MRHNLILGGLLLACALAVAPSPARADAARLGEERAWMLSATLGAGGGEVEDGNFVMSSHYLVFRAMGPRLLLGGRAGVFLEPSMGFGNPDRDASVFDAAPLVGLYRAFGRVTTVAAAGPALTIARAHTDFDSSAPPADRSVTAGLALDAGATIGLHGPLGLGLHAAANVNSEVTVLTGGVSFDLTF